MKVRLACILWLLCCGLGWPNLPSQPTQIYADFTFGRTNLTLFDGNNTFTNAARSLAGSNVTSTLTVNLPQSVVLKWDGNGNLTNDGTRSFAYSPENQLWAVRIQPSRCARTTSCTAARAPGSPSTGVIRNPLRIPAADGLLDGWVNSVSERTGRSAAWRHSRVRP
jgi:hypothetical protein